VSVILEWVLLYYFFLFSFFFFILCIWLVCVCCVLPAWTQRCYCRVWFEGGGSGRCVARRSRAVRSDQSDRSVSSVHRATPPCEKNKKSERRLDAKLTVNRTSSSNTRRTQPGGFGWIEGTKSAENTQHQHVPNL
jgi:hypothetical protein